MRFRTLDGNWDWNFGRGLSDYSDEAIAIAYDVKSKILSWYGDCFFDADAGIDWKNIIGTKDQKEKLDLDVKRIILEEENVTQITFFESSIIDRKYTCVVRFKTIYNETIEVKI